MAKTKATKTTGSKDMYIIVYSDSNNDNDDVEKITSKSNVYSSYEVFTSETAALNYLEAEISSGNFSRGFYSIAKITKTVNSTFTMKEVA